MARSAIKFTFLAAVSATVFSAFIGTKAKERPKASYPGFDEELSSPLKPSPVDSPDTPPKLKYDFKDKSVQDPLYYPNGGGLKLEDPANIKKDVEYDPVTGQYIIKQKIGDHDYRPPTYMSPEEYMDYRIQKQVKSYWRQRTNAEDIKKSDRALIPKLHVSGDLFDRIFGGNTVDIRPQGTAELIFGVNNSKTDNPVLPVKQRSITTFDFNEKIQLNVIGKIGDKLKLTTNYNTEATFDFENQMKIEYNGHEDEIIKKIEAGNVTLPLTGSLITGSASLFGVKTELQFGKLTATTIFSQQKGKKSEINVTGGAQVSNFEVTGDNYEANRHFFLSHYFRDRFDTALSKLPLIQSDVSITKVEVWVTNRSSTTTDLRNIVAFSDLGEDAKHVSTFMQPFIIDSANYTPKNGANDLYFQIADTLVGYLRERDFNKVTAVLPPQFVIARDYERIELSRRLAPTDFTFNQRLGYISLNQSLNYDEVLAVAFQYSVNGVTYQVGEFSTDGIISPKPLFVKLLKGTTVNPRLPIWDLMMKNIYSIGGYQINQQDFKMEVWYNNPATGVDINFLPDGPFKGKTLVGVLALDRLNNNGDALSDGVFDYIDGITINPNNGRIIFPVSEPFGNHLYNKLLGTNPVTNKPFADKYAFKELYDSTKTRAQQVPEKNRFKLKGSYKSASGSEISLNTVNVPQGSVTVTAGGIKLSENVDYTVDYTLGRVKIINEGILNSGTPIKISLESNSLFALQTKTMMGAHFDYKVNKDLVFGSTIMRLAERPLTQKVNIGDEPITNTVIGLDGNYKTEVPFITRMVDKLPFISTKQPSNLVTSAEVAKLFPGHSKAIGKDGNSYIDDFEGSISRIDIKSPQAWSLASVPQGQSGLFPEAALNDSLTSGFNRARLNWYVIDPLFLRQTSGLTPGHLSTTEMSNNFTREVLETEIFPNKQLATGTPTNTPVFDLAYYPSERGPYNYDVTGQPGYSSGIDTNGNLKNPTSRWGGIMSRVQTNDFEATNIEYLQFWMMDPFNSDNKNPSSTGDLYVNLGNISEDVLKDSRKSFENGLPADGSNTNVDETNWGRVPIVQNLVNAFDVDGGARPYQDVGLDGLNNATEKVFFDSPYIQQIAAAYGVNSTAYKNALSDPSGDDYHFYRGTDYDNAKLSVLERYKYYNGPDGNSPAAGQPNHAGLTESYTTSATATPNSEDINRDNTLSESEGYFQYKVSLRPSELNAVGQNFITDIFTTQGQNIKDGSSKPIKWYQFKIPIREFETKVGSIEDFRAIRFIRLFFKGVDKPIICRFARMEFIRGEWRRYDNSLLSDGEYLGTDGSSASFQTAAINIEENGTRSPVNYVIPPGIQRQINVQTSNLARLNEQALSMRVCELEDGNAKAAFRNLSLDVRLYKRLRMFIHGEAGPNGDPLNNGDLRVFVRLGSDYISNYYEYEIPLNVTKPGNYNGGDENDQYAVWPLSNELNLEFAKLQAAKQKRNIGLANGTAKLDMRYQATDGGNNIYIMGNPNLANVKTIMIGIRNPKQVPGKGDDDGLSKCAEVWVNELRLSDFDEHGGWASLARVKTDLADLGSVSLAGNYSTPGWGSIEKKVNERQQSTNYGYDLASNIELGKFTPQSFGIKIPMYFGYSEAFIKPRFNPLDPDINLSEVLKDENLSQSRRDSLRTVTVDYTRRKSLNFTNVRKEKGKNSPKPHIYDIENVALSYSYTEINHRDINIEYNNTRTYKAGLTWAFSPTPKSVKPFEKTKLSPKYFSLVKDFNFSPVPNRLGFTTDVDRFFNESKVRNNTGSSDVIIIPLYNKTFNMNRGYDLKWDLTKALKLDFTANNQGRIFEPIGRIDTKEKHDSVVQNLLNLGTTTKYRHAVNVNYTIPINKLPMLDFTSASVRYAGTYDWTRAPFAAPELGNTIQNSRSVQWNGQLNMTTLYNKIPYFKTLARKPLFTKKDPKQKEKEKEEEEKAKKAAQELLKAKSKLNVLAKDTSKAGKLAYDSLQKVITAADTLKKKKKNNNYELFDYLGRVIISVKNATFSFADNQGTSLPGYANSTNMMGMDSHFEGPTSGFVLGSQKDIRPTAVQNDWLVKTPTLNLPYTNTLTKNFTARVNIEPFPDLKIELNGNRNYSESNSEFYRWDSLNKIFISQAPTLTGTFSMSFLSIRTAFEKQNKAHFSQNWVNFLNYRATVSGLRGEQYTLSKLSSKNTGFIDGYDASSQEVTIPSFLAAYAGHSPHKSDLNTFPFIPMPNWRITYDGLSKFESIKKLFRAITLSHSYRSSYNVSSFTQNLNFVGNADDGLTTVRDATSNFVSRLTIGSVSISEQFAPLLKVDMTWNNSLMTSVEVRKERNLSLAMSNIQLQELNSKEVVVGAGYRLKDLKIKMGKRNFKSDLNLKVDVSFKNNITVMRQASTDIAQATSGQNIITIKSSADYVLNEKLTVRAFFDRIINKPVISSSFPTSNTNAGISLRFTLAQ